MGELRDAELKIGWAENRLRELESLIGNYRASDPYGVRNSIEGKRKARVWRLQITQQPPPGVSLLLGEIAYNLRASLEYLAADLVKSSIRSKSFYPFLQQRIWEVPIGDEATEKGRADDRRKWAFIEREMPADAVQIIKRFHPPNGRPERSEPMYNLSVLNALANKDRHRKLNVVAAGLEDTSAVFTFIYRDGTRENSMPSPGPNGVRRTFAHDAQIATTPDVVDVKVEGTVKVIVEVSPEWAYIAIPEDINGIFRDVAMLTVELLPYARD